MFSRCFVPRRFMHRRFMHMDMHGRRRDFVFQFFRVKMVERRLQEPPQ